MEHDKLPMPASSLPRATARERGGQTADSTTDRYTRYSDGHEGLGSVEQDEASYVDTHRLLTLNMGYVLQLVLVNLD